MIAPANHRFLTRLLVALLLILAMSTTLSGYAQAPVTDIDELTVDLWPDYDQPSVLVLITGSLPEDTTLPATVTVPIPDNATVNAVARIEGNELFTIADVDESVPGSLTLTTPAPGFRVEYYMPYEVEGDNHSFSFAWQADLTVESLSVSIQQPSLAQDMNVVPASDEVISGADTLRYHNLQARPVPAGENFSVEVGYRMADNRLTTAVLTDFQPVSGPESTPSATEDAFNWPLLLAVMGSVLVVAALGWFVLSRRQTQRVLKPRPVRQTPARRSTPRKERPAGGKTRYCHECGQPVDPTDRFCRNCGTPVKDI